MFKKLILFFFVASFLLSSSSVLLAGDGWSGDPFNPTSSVNTSPAKKSWIPKPKLPSWMKSKKQTGYGKKPSTLSKVGTTTKKLWNNTLSALDPYPDSPAPKAETSSFVESSKPKKESFFSGWGKSKEKDAADLDVNAFLAQPQVQ